MIFEFTGSYVEEEDVYVEVDSIVVGSYSVVGKNAFVESVVVVVVVPSTVQESSSVAESGAARSAPEIRSKTELL